MFFGLLVREQGDQREQANACRCGTYNRYVIPLAVVGCAAQMRSHGLKRRFPLPTENKPRHDLHSRRVKIRPF
jgi:hypothetical protein